METTELDMDSVLIKIKELESIKNWKRIGFEFECNRRIGYRFGFNWDNEWTGLKFCSIQTKELDMKSVSIRTNELDAKSNSQETRGLDMESDLIVANKLNMDRGYRTGSDSNITKKLDEESNSK